MSKMKKLTTALVVAGSLLAVEAHAAKLTDNTLSLGVSSRDSDTGFMIGIEGRPKGTTGLALSGDYLREDFGPLTRSRLRVALGAGHFFEAGDMPQYAAVRGGLWYDDLTGVDNEASWYAQAHYELTPVDQVDAGLVLSHTDAWNGGTTLEAYGRYHFNQHFAGELSYTADFDDVEGDDRIMVSLRISHDWL